MVVHASGSVPLGILSDKYIRKRIISIGISIWSVATFCTGLVQNFFQLLITRGIVGIGEASYVPAATSLIADNFPVEKRAKASSLFHMGMFFGGTLGMILAGVIGTHFGWRTCFYIVALPGIFLAFTVLRIKEKEQKPHFTKQVTVKNIAALFKSQNYLLTLIGGAMLTFTSSAIIAWITQFFVRYHNLSVEQASLSIGLMIIIAGPLGIYCGGHFADLFFNKYNIPRSFVIGIAFIISSPIMLVTLTTSNMIMMYASLFLGSFLMTMYYGPMVALIQDIVPSGLKATAFAFYLFFVHILGSTPAPAVIGKISDIYNLQTAMYITIATNFLGGVFFLINTKLIKNNQLKGLIITPKIIEDPIIDY